MGVVRLVGLADGGPNRHLLSSWHLAAVLGVQIVVEI